MSAHDPQPSEHSDCLVEPPPIEAVGLNDGDVSGTLDQVLKAASEEGIGELLAVQAELQSACGELRALREELADTRSDLFNLMTSTRDATVFLDQALAIRRYTPRAADILKLVPADLGKSLAKQGHFLNYPELAIEAEKVLRTLLPLEREIRDEESQWFLLTLSPYRTVGDRIGGVVLTLQDITEQKEAAEMRALDLDATTRLSEISVQFASGGDPQELLDAILESSIAIMLADAGTLQIFDPADSTLRILSHRGVPPYVAEHFAVVNADSRSPCGRALEIGRRVTTLFDASLPDPTGDLRWHREEAGWLSAQSTPLIGQDGSILGMLSTHWKLSHFPNDRQLRFFDLLVRLAADSIERRQVEVGKPGSQGNPG